MTKTEQELRTLLRSTGLTSRAIDAAWPAWWSESAEASPSAVAELRFSLARQLGLSPPSLLVQEDPQFLWKDETKYKNLGAVTDREAAVLASFSVSVARSAFAGVSSSRHSLPDSATAWRSVLLRHSPSIGLSEMLTGCWALGIPVLQLRVFPLRQKRMHSVAARLGERFAILIGHESQFPSQVAFWIAHELGHIANGHLDDSAAVVDVEDPLGSHDRDSEEEAADEYALELLTGSSRPSFESSVADYTATELAIAAQRIADERAVDPGVVALGMGHADGAWQQAIGALKILGEVPAGDLINTVAAQQLDWSAMGTDSGPFLKTVLGAE